MNPSNKSLAFLVISAMALSLFSTTIMLNQLRDYRPVVTGRAQTQQGTVNLTVETTASIILRGNTIMDFGTGFVNNSDTNCDFGGGSGSGGSTHANLSMEGNNYTDDGNCWVRQGSATGQPENSFYIENDGNTAVTLTIQCPTPTTFFGSYTPAGGENTRHNLSWKSRNNETSACSGGLQATYLTCDNTQQNVCGASNFQSTPEDQDEIAVDFELIIPYDLASQAYDQTITFTAS